MTNGRLEGRVAVVTGGATGIGEAICLRLASDGASVVVLDVNEPAAELTAALCGGRAAAADVSDGAAVDDVVRRVVAELGRLDIWINNAGVPSTAEYRRKIDERSERRLREAEVGDVITRLDALVSVDDAEWKRMIDIHLAGSFYGMRAAARAMSERRSGAIVNISSICGIAGCEAHPHYSAAKAGIIGLTRATARELVGVNIRVNAVAPGIHRQLDRAEHLRGCRTRDSRVHSGGTPRPACRDRRHGVLPGLGRGRVHRRPGDQPERWHRHVVIDGVEQ